MFPSDFMKHYFFILFCFSTQLYLAQKTTNPLIASQIDELTKQINQHEQKILLCLDSGLTLLTSLILSITKNNTNDTTNDTLSSHTLLLERLLDVSLVQCNNVNYDVMSRLINILHHSILLVCMSNSVVNIIAIDQSGESQTWY